MPKEGPSGKSTKMELFQIKVEIKDMILAGVSEQDISETIEKKYKKARRTVRAYILSALEDAMECETKDLEKQRQRQKLLMWRRIRRLLKLFDDTQNPKYEALAQNWHDKYLKMWPSGLAPEEEDSELSLNILFNKLD